MNRTKFLQITSFGIGAAGLGGWLLKAPVRVRPINPGTCGKSFLRFCQTARFHSAEEAVLVAGRRGKPFEVFFDADSPAELPAQPLESLLTPGLAEPGDLSPEAHRVHKAIQSAMMRNRADPTTVTINQGMSTGTVV